MTASQNTLKQNVAQAALDYLISKPLDNDAIIGIGTGSTTNYFIDLLASIKHQIGGTVASSFASAERLKSHNIPVYDLNTVNEVVMYIDGADEVNTQSQLIKGGGGALTREKIIAQVALEFICIADHSKYKETLGAFPLPIEVIPMARSLVAKELLKLGGNVIYRQGFTTDNGNIILDVTDLDMTDPAQLENKINNIVGVVTNGLFAQRGADQVFLAYDHEIKTLGRHASH